MSQGVNIEKYDALITEVEAPAEGSEDEGKPGLIFYSGVICNSPDAGGFTRQQPIRRISKSARIVPAQVGDPCEVKYVNGKFFLVVLEGVAARECRPN